MEIEGSKMEVDEHSEGNTGANKKLTVSTTLTLQYYTEEQLGIGFIGTTVFKGILEGKWEADNKKKGKNVAAKAYSNLLLEWLENDVVTLTSAEGHNVVRYICTLTNENKAMSDYRYLAMELCNATLKDWTENTTEKGIAVQGIKDLDILSQCVSGLMFIHEIGLTHGNLRPTNILLLKESENNIVVKISDFGLKIKNDKEDKSYHPKSPHGHGPLGWRSPEFWNNVAFVNEGEAGIKSDIFSLGCIFYYVVTKGKHPFGDINSPIELQFNIANGEIGNLSDDLSCPEYKSRGVLSLIKLMIDSLPNNRPPLEIVQSHPVFWETVKIFRFFGQINTFRRNTTAFIEKVFEQLKNLVGEKNVLENGENWIEPAKTCFGHNFGSSYTEGVTELIRAIRNFGDEGHRYDRFTPIQIRFKTSIEYINSWLNSFPKLLPCAWIAFKSLHAAGYSELNKFYGQWKEEGEWETISQVDEEYVCILSNLCKELV